MWLNNIYRRILLTIVIIGLVMIGIVVAAMPLNEKDILSAEQIQPPQPAIHAIPSSDDTAIFIAAEGLAGVSTPIYANIGPTSHERSHTGLMEFDSHSNTHFYTFEGLSFNSFTSPWVSITTTGAISSETEGSITMDRSDFALHYIEGNDFESFVSRDGNVQLDIASGVITDTHMIIMDTVVPPGNLPHGHRLLNEAYSIRPSGAITQSQAPYILRLFYDPAALGDTDPHTLSIFEWNPSDRQWRDIKSEPFGMDTAHFKSVEHFGTYALVAGTTWRDPFQNLTGLDGQEDIRLTGGQLALENNVTEGYAISMPITPTQAISKWGRLHYEAEVVSDTTLTVDILAADGSTVLLANVSDGAGLAAINPAEHSSLRLRVTMNTQQAGITPYLDSWSIAWTPPTTFLPVIQQGEFSTYNSIDRSHIERKENNSEFGCSPPPDPTTSWSLPLAVTNGDKFAIGPDIAVDSDGRLHAVWYDGNISYAIKEPGETTWSTPLPIPESNGGSYPAIAIDPQDTMHVIWRQGSALKYASRPLDSVWSSPVDLSTTVGWVGPHLDIFADVNSDLHVVWSDDSSGNNDIFYTYKANGVTSWQTPERVADTPDLSLAPTVIADTQNIVHVVWHDSSGTNDIFYASKPESSGTWTGTVNISASASGSQWPALALGENDELHLVWQDTLPRGGQGQDIILYYASKQSGNNWSAPQELTRKNALLGEKAQTPALGVSATGALHVAWADYTDYTMYHMVRPDAIAGWSTPQAITTFVPPTDPPNQWVFDSMATDDFGGIHLLWNERASSTSFKWDIKYSAALPPPIPENHVLVLEEDGQAVRGACVYQNGQLVGTTDSLGIFAPDTLSVGDNLVALKPLAELPSGRTGDWAYRTALTSLEIDSGGVIAGHTVQVPGRQQLTLQPDRPLIYFNLIVSIQWNATDAYIQQVANAVHQASNYLFDISDGQMVFGNVAIYDDGDQWQEADIQIITRNNVRPYAYIGGIEPLEPTKKIRVGRHWDGASGNQGDWDNPEGFRTLVHEFGHYALYLYDSYFQYLYDSNNNVIGVSFAYACTERTLSPDNDATNASIMSYQYAATEFSAQNVPGLWDSENCVHTVQWQLNGESDWETILRYYADDNEEPARWQFMSPMQSGQVMIGPSEMPETLINFPQITTNQANLPAPLRLLTVMGPDGLPYAEGALVALDTQRANGSSVTLDQGVTDGNGQICIYGAATGNSIRAVSIDGSISAEGVVGVATSYVFGFTSSQQLLSMEMSQNPYISLMPDSEGRNVTVMVHGIPNGAALATLVVPPGGSAAQNIGLSYSLIEGAYVGTASFAVPESGLGSTHLRGVSSLAQPVSLDVDFTLSQAETSTKQDVFSPDGNVWMHFEPNSFQTTNVFMILMPTGSVPQPLPAGKVVVGNAYSVRASGSIMDMEKTAVLRLFYDPTQLDTGINPDSLQIARWNGTEWTPLVSEPDNDHFAIAALTSEFGIYTLLAPAPIQQQTHLAQDTIADSSLNCIGALEKMYLPLVTR